MSGKNASAENPEEIRLYVESFYENDYANEKSNSNSSSPAKKSGLLSGFYKKSSTANQSELIMFISLSQ